MLVCAFFAQTCTRDRGCSAHPAFPAPSSWRDNEMKTSGKLCREKANLCLEMATQAPHTRCHHPPCAQLRTGAGDPVRRGFSAETLTSLEYWIARSRLRQPPSSEGGLRRSRGYAAAPLCWRAEALAKAASRRR